MYQEQLTLGSWGSVLTPPNKNCVLDIIYIRPVAFKTFQILGMGGIKETVNGRNRWSVTCERNIKWMKQNVCYAWEKETECLLRVRKRNKMYVTCERRKQNVCYAWKETVNERNRMSVTALYVTTLRGQPYVSSRYLMITLLIGYLLKENGKE